MLVFVRDGRLSLLRVVVLGLAPLWLAGKCFFFGCGFDYSGVLIFVSTCAIMVLFFFLRNLSFFRRFVVI